jgi:hypothetical protein
VTDDEETGKAFGSAVTGASMRVVTDEDDGGEYVGMFLTLDGVEGSMVVTFRADQALRIGQALIQAGVDIEPIADTDVQ